MKPKISIIMPVYNASNFLENTIKSILNQKYKQFELIIIDDGSSDGSELICDKYCKKDDRIKVIHTKNQGICKSRNLGLKLAKGEYVTFADHDDLIDKYLLEDNYKLLKEENADWIKFGKIEHIYYEQKLIKVNYSNFKKNIYSDKEAIKENIISLRFDGILTYVWDAIFRKSIIDKLNLTFDEKFKFGNEDIDFCQRYIAGCNKMIINNKNYYNHFTRIGISTSSKFSKEKIESHLYLAKKSIDVFNDYNINIDLNRDKYMFLLGRYTIFNICRDLNKAPLNFTKKDKISILKEIRKDNIFKDITKFNKSGVFKLSIKIGIYLQLFIKEKYITLLLIDKYSQKIVYKIRTIKSKEMAL